jgi:beta-galactosidase
MMDIYRLPKFVYYFYQSQRDPELRRPDVAGGPMVFIANYWTPRTRPAPVVVYANGDEVELQLNGKVLRRQKPDSGPDTRYSGKASAAEEEKGKDYSASGGNPFDGGNAPNLAHPPFTFRDVGFEPGELKAVAYRQGQAVAQHVVRTPEAPAALRLEFDTTGVPLRADGADAIFVRAYVVDRHGTVAPESTAEVTFAVEGPARLVGANPLPAEAGIASVLLQAGGQAGAVAVRANAPGLAPAAGTITSQTP